MPWAFKRYDGRAGAYLDQDTRRLGRGWYASGDPHLPAYVQRMIDKAAGSKTTAKTTAKAKAKAGGHPTPGYVFVSRSRAPREPELDVITPAEARSATRSGAQHVIDGRPHHRFRLPDGRYVFSLWLEP